MKNRLPDLWIFKKGFPQGAFWATLTACVSILNDVLARMAGTRLDGLEITFFRFLFGMLTILPLMLLQGKKAFATSHPKQHILRAVFGVAAIALYIYSVLALPLTDVTTFSFSQPLFLLPLASIFLKEKVSKNRWIATIFGFLGIVIIANPGGEAFNPLFLIPMGAAFLFAALDILAKRMVGTESMTTLLFYFALGTSLAALGPALYVWKAPNMTEYFWLLLYGLGGNLIQVCLFMAFKAADASSLAPFRYMELMFAAIFGYVLFAEIPASQTLMGAAVIIMSTLYLTYHERFQKKRRAKL